MKEVAAMLLWIVGLWIIGDSAGFLRFVAGLVRVLHGVAP